MQQIGQLSCLMKKNKFAKIEKRFERVASLLYFLAINILKKGKIMTKIIIDEKEGREQNENFKIKKNTSK